MGYMILVWLLLAGICFGAAAAVYSKLRKLGKNPWPLSIITFVLTGVLILGALFVLFLTTWER